MIARFCKAIICGRSQAGRRRGPPFVFLSGYGSEGLPDSFKGALVLKKPCSSDALMRALEAVLPNNAMKEKTSALRYEVS